MTLQMNTCGMCGTLESTPTIETEPIILPQNEFIQMSLSATIERENDNFIEVALTKVMTEKSILLICWHCESETKITEENIGIDLKSESKQSQERVEMWMKANGVLLNSFLAMIENDASASHDLVRISPRALEQSFQNYLPEIDLRKAGNAILVFNLSHALFYQLSNA